MIGYRLFNYSVAVLEIIHIMNVIKNQDKFRGEKGGRGGMLRV